MIDFDQAYSDRAMIAMWQGVKAVAREQMVTVQGNQVALIRPNEVIMAAIRIIAFAIASDPSVQTPQARRLFAESTAKLLAKRIGECQAQGADTALPIVSHMDLKGFDA
jgi:hypothetical protein